MSAHNDHLSVGLVLDIPMHAAHVVLKSLVCCVACLLVFPENEVEPFQRECSAEN